MKLWSEKEIIDEFNQHERLIHFVLNKKFHIHQSDILYGMTYWDLYSEGKIGLISAFDKFDDLLGYKKSTFYVECIQNQYHKIFKNYKCKKRLANYNTISLNTIVNKDEDPVEIIELINDSQNYFYQLQNEMYIKQIIESSNLTFRQRQVLRYVMQGYNLNEISLILKVSEPAISHAFTSSIKKVKKVTEILKNSDKTNINLKDKKLKVNERNNKRLNKYIVYDTWNAKRVMKDTFKYINAALFSNISSKTLRSYIYKKVLIYNRYYIFKEAENIDDFINEKGNKKWTRSI